MKPMTPPQAPENQKDTVKIPSPRDMQRAVDNMIAAQRGLDDISDEEARRRYSATRPRFGGPALKYTVGAEFTGSLSPEQMTQLEALKAQLEALFSGEVGVIVHTPDEAATALGLERKDVEAAYGLIGNIEEDRTDDDLVEFRAISFATDDSGEHGTGTSQGLFAEGAKYLGRFHYNADNNLISVALDAVPVVENNAAYVIRDDLLVLGSMDAALRSKQSIRATDTYRQIQHNNRSGLEGTRRRIVKALTMPYERFLDRNIDLS